MSATARQVSVIVDADSAPLQAEVVKAADALKELGAELAKQQKVALQGADETVKANSSVADSYVKLSGSVRGSTLEIVKSIQTQVAEQQRAADGAVSGSRLTVEANARTVESLKAAAAESAAAADKQVEGYKATGDAAEKAGAKQVVAAKTARDAQVKSFGSSGTALVDWGKKTVLGLTAAAGASVYLSQKFESASLKLQTQAGASTGELAKLRNGVLSMAGALGQTPDHLAEGLYHVVSSMEKMLPEATRTSEELRIMKVAAEGAAVGGTSMEETSYALASAMNSLHLRAGDAGKTMGELNAIVGSGDMTMVDLLAELKSGLIPTANQFGISLQAVGASLAVMGDMGMRGATAGTRLRMSIALLGAPTAKAAELLGALGMSGSAIQARTKGMTEALKEAGLSTTTLATDLKRPDGIAYALRDLHDHLEASGLSATQAAAVMVRAFGGGRMASTIDLLEQNVGRIGIKYKQIGKEAGKFGEDWAKTQETLKFQLDQVGASAEALGVKVGEDLTPYVKSLLGDLKETADWLDHNRVAAEALAGIIGGGLSVAVAAFTVNRVAKMVGGLKEAARFMGFTSSGSTGVAGSSRGVGPTSLAGGIVGARGASMAGSLANPIVVAIESGQYAGLGGQGAAFASSAGTEADVKTAAAEGKNVESGVPLGVLPAAEQDVEKTSILASLKTGMGSIMQGAMRGGLVGLTGIFASEMAKSAIGGKTGDTVGNIGKDTALGAALGTAIEPGIGTAIGAGFGGVIGAIKAIAPPTAAAKQAEALAAGSGKPNLGGKFEAEEGKYLSLLTSELAKLKPAGQRSSTEQRIAHTDESRIEPLVGEDLGKSEKEYVLSGTKNPGVQSIIDTSKADLEKLAPMGREAMAGFIRSMVQTLEKEGRLPHDSLARVLSSLKPELEGLPHLAAQTGKETSASLAANLKSQEMLSKLSTVAKEINSNWAREFGLLPVTTHQTLAQAETATNTDLGKLTDLMRHGTAQQMSEAKDEYAKLAPALKSYLDSAKDAVSTELGALAHQTGPLSAEGVSKITAAYNALPKSLKEALDNAGGAVQKGIEKINKETSVELKVLGGASGIAGAAVKGLPKLAQGGLLQLGRPGEAGKDTIPLSIGGQNIMAGAGETAAIFTRHQRADVESRLPGGLPSVFANKRPNYMASGGFVAEPGTNYSVGKEPQIAADLKRLGEYLHVTLEGISGYRSPEHSVEVGGFANDPHTRGEASDTLGTQSIASAILARFGLERPFPGAAEADHMQLLGSLGHPSGAAAGAGGIAGAVAQAVAQITAPKVGGSGVVAQIAQAALDKVAAGANSVLGASSSSSGIGAGFSGPWTQVMAQIASRKHWNLADWKQVVSLESGGNPRAVNPSSGAAGLGQALGATKTEFPKMVSANPSTQIEGMGEYIASRYGNPTAALEHEHAYHWYEQGGFVNAATGLDTKATTPKQKVKLPKAPKLKGAGTGHKQSPSIASLIHSLGAVPETENVKALQPFPPLLAQLEGTRALLGKIEHIPDRYVVGQDGMEHLAHTIAPGESINAGMSVTEAQRQQVAAMTRAKGESTPLTEQGEILAWLGELPSHHLLTAEDAGQLHDPRLKAGMQMGSAAESIMGSELGENVRLREAEVIVQGTWERLAEKYRERQAQVLKHAKAEYKRYANIKDQIQRLTTGSLQQKLAAAESKDAKAQLKQDATLSSDAISENIEGERALPKAKQHPALINQWEKEKQHISEYSTKLSKPAAGAPAARVALQKNELQNELVPLGESLKTLTGNSTSVGKGGDYGTLATDLTKLNTGVTELGARIATETTSTIPSLRVELQTTAAENADANLKPAPAALEPGETNQEAALNSLLKEQLQQVSERAAIEGAQLKTLTNFIPQIPHYQKGGPVLDDGLIYAHKGEHVVPVGGTLAVNSTSPAVHNHISVNGSLAPLLQIIDERVQHPTNVRGVSRQLAQRGDLLRAR